MGQTCSCVQVVEAPTMNDPESGMGDVGRHGSCPDPLIYDMVRRSSTHHHAKGQHHLLYRKGRSHIEFKESAEKSANPHTTQLILRRLKPEHSHMPSSTHIYAIRSPDMERPEQRPTQGVTTEITGTDEQENTSLSISTLPITTKTARPKTSSTTTTRSSSVATKFASSASSKQAVSITMQSDNDLALDPYTPTHMAPAPKKSGM